MTLLSEAHEARTRRIVKQTKAASVSATTTTFSKTAKAGILVGAGAVGRACKLAFFDGLETDPGIATTFLAKWTLNAKHSHIDAFIPKVKHPRNCIPMKAVTDAYSGMPKSSACHRDGRTWELLRDAAETP